jgi:hypothetical protein
LPLFSSGIAGQGKALLFSQEAAFGSSSRESEAGIVRLSRLKLAIRSPFYTAAQ